MNFIHSKKNKTPYLKEESRRISKIFNNPEFKESVREVLSENSSTKNQVVSKVAELYCNLIKSQFFSSCTNYKISIDQANYHIFYINQRKIVLNDPKIKDTLYLEDEMEAYALIFENQIDVLILQKEIERQLNLSNGYLN